jgi:DNA-binding NtrC family response regulator
MNFGTLGSEISPEIVKTDGVLRRKDMSMASILVIDDDPQLRATLRIALNRAGYEVHCANEGEQGIDLLRSHAIDMVISDILMPGKEGIETIIELHKLYPDIKIVAISGGGVTGNIGFLEMAKKFGAVRALAKPFAMTVLIDCLRDLQHAPA